MAQRESTASFDVVFAGETSTDCEQGAKTVHPYREAGVTWWLESIWTERGSFEDMWERIRQDLRGASSKGSTPFEGLIPRSETAF
jgi:hypothetical protein